MPRKIKMPDDVSRMLAEMRETSESAEVRKGTAVAAAAEGTTSGWTWDTYEWNPEAKGGRRIDPKNIKGTGIAFDVTKDRLKVPKGREKEFEAYMDRLANPPKTATLEDGTMVPVKSALVPKDWRTNKDYDRDYDFVAAFLEGVEPGPVNHGKDGYYLHMNDVGKLPTHPTFSVESPYAKDPRYSKLAGSWVGETYVPGEAERAVRQAAKAGDAGASGSSAVPKGHNPALDGYSGPRIVVNPSTFKNEKDALCVTFDEAFRILMEVNGFDPVAEPTEKQRQFFADTAYANDENMMRRTILARICTFDTSVTDPTDEQLQEAVEFLETVMEIGAPQNEWEQRAVQRIHDAVAKTVGQPGAEEPAAPGTEQV